MFRQELYGLRELAKLGLSVEHLEEALSSKLIDLISSSRDAPR